MFRENAFGDIEGHIFFANLFDMNLFIAAIVKYVGLLIRYQQKE